MSQRSRVGIGLVTFAVLAILAAVPVAAGNYAEVEVTSGLDAPPTAGEGRELGLLLLQHGVTPVDHGRVLVTAVLADTGETVTADAAPLGDGAWTATITFPTGGDWQLRVTHSEFETPQPMAVSVGDATSPLSALVIPVGLVGAALSLVLAATALVRRSRHAGPPAPTASSGESPLHGG